MLIFFKDAGSYFGDRDDVYIEWSNVGLEHPVTVEDCPRPAFTVPELSAVIYRCNEYPESWDVFEQQGHYQCYLFPRTQSTKIGRETFFIQNDPLTGDRELICALNSLQPEKKWPFTDLEELPAEANERGEHYEWGKYRMMFGDVGCMYFMIDRNGSVTWSSDCH